MTSYGSGEFGGTAADAVFESDLDVFDIRNSY
jgi:hypothetical protein